MSGQAWCQPGNHTVPRALSFSVRKGDIVVQACAEHADPADLPPKPADIVEQLAEKVNVDDLSAFLSDLVSDGEGRLRDWHLEKLVRYILTEALAPEAPCP